MSSGSGDAQVRKVVDKIVNDVVKELENLDTATQSLETQQQALENEHRRSSRCRKEPDRLASTVKQPTLAKKKKKEPFNCEMVMAPVPSHVRGILKPERPYPRPRKSSLAVTAGKTIVKKYRKVRILRRLNYKVIPPLAGWRPDRTRMPEDEPDEEEQLRLDEQAELEKEEAEAQRKRRKRKSIGMSAVPPVSDEASIDGEEESNWMDHARTSSPDLFYKGYIKAGNSDSDEVLSDADEKEEEEEEKAEKTEKRREPLAIASFSFADEDDEEQPGPSNRQSRRRSMRIQSVGVEKPKAEEKRERRKSKVFPVTPMKESSPREAKPVEKTEKSVRRRSGMVRNVSAKKEEEASSSTKPLNDDSCRLEEQKKSDEAQNMERKTNKVSAWLMNYRREAAAEMEAGGDTGGMEGSDEIEVARGNDGREMPFSEKSTEATALTKTSRSDQKGRKGRRSTKMQREVGGKENEEVESKGKSEPEEKPKPHPFFAQFAPKPALPAVPPEKKQARRRSMFVPKKSVAAKKDDTPVEKEKEEEEIEIVAEISKEKKEKEKEDGDISHPDSTTASIWRSSEIDAAPYAGLVHVGREEKKEETGGEDCEGIVKKMRRLSVYQPRLSSYSIPSSLRSEESEPVEIVPVFDEERKESLLNGDAAIEVATTVSWPKNVRPKRVEDCLGDMEVLMSGKKWLQKWKKRLDAVSSEDDNVIKAPKAKRKKRRGGAYSDESEQEDSDPDYEVRDEEHRLPNPLVLSGPIGCGKTTYIRTLSEDVGFSILESSPDDRRTGSSLRTKLIGAVANYSVSSKPAGGIASFFSAKREGEGEEKKKKEEGKRGRQHTLVVIEHVDVVFAEEDKLFWPALSEIIATAKIPMVLICNVVPYELSRVLRQAEEGGVEPMEMTMERPEGMRMADHVMASVTGPCGRALSSTVVPAIVTRARQDLRAAFRDTHWAAVAAALSQADLVDSSMRRVDESAMCDTVASQTFAWTDECERRAEAKRANDMTRAAEWPARCGMPGEVYTRLCTQIDKIDQDAFRREKGRADRMMNMARSGVAAGNGGRSGLLTRGEIAMDWMPILEQIDRDEQEKKKMNGRRHQHYFNVIKDLETGASIDPLDRIKGACAFFRLPQSNNPQ